MTAVEFPAMRSDVLDALRALADRRYQEREWGRYDPKENRYDDLTLNVHLLYDDCRVLPDPSSGIGTVLYPTDVAPLEKLAEVLGPLINDLGDSPDATYLADPRWPQVVDAAGRALAAMEAHE